MSQSLARENSPSPPRQRKIIHCDCDCFYAAVELLDNPALVGKPIAVGGSSNRGVVATCSYEAREHGIHSAMPMARALRLCPDLQVIPPRMDRYREASRAMHRILADYTPLIEPLSLDEAYLDVSDADACRGSATLIATEIRRRVREELGFTLSAGVAPNKFLAKVASDWRKPDGLTVVRPEEVQNFVRDLGVEKLPGVGPVTRRKLGETGIFTCRHIQQLGEAPLTERFGVHGRRLFELAGGRDEREVRVARNRKSLSVENTYPEDLPGLSACLERLPALMASFAERFGRLDSRYRVLGSFVKIRFADFSLTTVARHDLEPNLENFRSLCEEGFARRSLPVRLLGLGVRLGRVGAESDSGGAEVEQSELFD